MQEVLEFTTVVAGDVASFDASAYTADLAEYLSVPPSTIKVTAAAASVRVTATITPAFTVKDGSYIMLSVKPKIKQVKNKQLLTNHDSKFE